MSNGSAASRPAVADGPVPKHEQLRAILLAAISAELAPGDAIPSERRLVERYGVSRATVREAVGRLVTEGRLARVHGKGTFVARPRVESHLHLASFTEDMRRRGLEPHTDLLAAGEATPPSGIAEALALERGASAYRIERRRGADAEPMAHEVGWYPAALLPGLLEQDLTGSLYALLGDHYGLAPDAGSQALWTEPCAPDVAGHLGLPDAAPVLVFERTSTARGRPVEHTVSRYRGDRYRLSMSLAPRD